MTLLLSFETWWLRCPIICCQLQQVDGCKGNEFLCMRCSFVVKCGNTSKNTDSSPLQNCKVLHPWMPFWQDDSKQCPCCYWPVPVFQVLVTGWVRLGVNYSSDPGYFLVLVHTHTDCESGPQRAAGDTTQWCPLCLHPILR